MSAEAEECKDPRCWECWQKRALEAERKLTEARVSERAAWHQQGALARHLEQARRERDEAREEADRRTREVELVAQVQMQRTMERDNARRWARLWKRCGRNGLATVRELEVEASMYAQENAGLWRRVWAMEDALVAARPWVAIATSDHDPHRHPLSLANAKDALAKVQAALSQGVTK